MKRLIAIKLLIFLFFSNNSFSQERIKYEKDTIYINFNNYIDSCNDKYPIVKSKWRKKMGIQFNLCGEARLLFKSEFISDTLSLSQLKNIKISTLEEIEQLERDFRNKTSKKLPMTDTDKLYKFYNKNDLFVTYLIENLKQEHFVIYPVIWLNQDEMEINTRFKSDKN